MKYNKFSKDHFFHGSQTIAVFLTKDPPHLFPQPYNTLNQREFWKIASIIDGEGVLIINGHRYPVSPGFVCLIHPQDLTTWELTVPLTLYNVIFQYQPVKNEINNWMGKNDFFSIFRTSECSGSPVRHELLHLLDTNRTITALIKKMHQEYIGNDLHAEDFLRIYLLELLLELSRSSLQHFSRNRKMTVLNFIRKKLLSYPPQMPDIPSLCRESGFSHNYLLTAYKKAFHETMGRTLLNKRIEYAIELLKQSDLPVSQICQRCGFSDVSNFYRVFRRETNCSPNSCRDGKDMK